MCPIPERLRIELNNFQSQNNVTTPQPAIVMSYIWGILQQVCHCDLSIPRPQTSLACNRISLWSYFFTGMVWWLFTVKSGENAIDWTFVCTSEPPYRIQECSQLHIPAITEANRASELTCPRNYPGAEYLGGGWVGGAVWLSTDFQPLSWACDLRDALQIKLSSSWASRGVVNLYHDNLRPWPDWMAQGLYFPVQLVSVVALNSSRGFAKSWSWKYSLIFEWCSN